MNMSSWKWNFTFTGGEGCGCEFGTWENEEVDLVPSCDVALRGDTGLRYDVVLRRECEFGTWENEEVDPVPSCDAALRGDTGLRYDVVLWREEDLALRRDALVLRCDAELWWEAALWRDSLLLDESSLWDGSSLRGVPRLCLTGHRTGTDDRRRSPAVAMTFSPVLVGLSSLLRPGDNPWWLENNLLNKECDETAEDNVGEGEDNVGGGCCESTTHFAMRFWPAI
jgi:hypothetical protein